MRKLHEKWSWIKWNKLKPFNLVSSKLKWGGMKIFYHKKVKRTKRRQHIMKWNMIKQNAMYSNKLSEYILIRKQL